MKRNVLGGNRPKESSYNPPKSPFACLWQEKDYQRGIFLLLPLAKGGWEGFYKKVSNS